MLDYHGALTSVLPIPLLSSLSDWHDVFVQPVVDQCFQHWNCLSQGLFGDRIILNSIIAALDAFCQKTCHKMIPAHRERSTLGAVLVVSLHQLLLYIVLRMKYIPHYSSCICLCIFRRLDEWDFNHLIINLILHIKGVLYCVFTTRSVGQIPVPGIGSLQGTAAEVVETHLFPFCLNSSHSGLSPT